MPEALDLLAVGLGGGLGAICRYGISLLPLKSSFPLATLFTNLLGALLIGFVAGLASRDVLSSRANLFWRTGVCGGFTTFSTFSLETLRLLEERKLLTGGLYAALSVGLCLLGVAAGLQLSRRIPSL